MTQPVYSVRIEGNNMPAPIVVNAYAGKTPTQLILNSTLNDEANFTDENGYLAKKIYASKTKFLKGPETTK